METSFCYEIVDLILDLGQFRLYTSVKDIRARIVSIRRNFALFPLQKNRNEMFSSIQRNVNFQKNSTAFHWSKLFKKSRSKVTIDTPSKYFWFCFCFLFVLYHLCRSGKLRLSLSRIENYLQISSDQIYIYIYDPGPVLLI